MTISSDIQSAPSTARRHWPVRLVTWLATLYALLLITYLVLRIIPSVAWWWLPLLHNFTPYYFLPLLLFIPLLLMLRLWRVAVRLLPLLLIGLWLYGPRWLPKSSVTASAPSLTVVSFNIQFMLDGPERIVEWLAASDADLVLLQEVGPDNSAQLFALLSDEYPYTVDLVGTTQTTLSRLPITHSERFNLAVTDDQRRDLGSWYADRLVVDVAGQALAVYNNLSLV